jgi:hypothetical protein
MIDSTRRRYDGKFSVLGIGMAKNLQSSWTVGKTRVTHAGFGVYKVRGFNSPTDSVSGPIESAKRAVEIAEGFGDGYAAFRIVQSSAGLGARELLRREDLPINLL